MSTPPKSVTVSEFLGLGQVPTPAPLRAGGLQQLPDAGSARTPCHPWVAGEIYGARRLELMAAQIAAWGPDHHSPN